MKMDSLNNTQVRLDDLMPLIREQIAAGQNVRLYPKGTSMMPMLRQGIDSVILSPLPDKLCKYDLPLYQRDNGQYVLHRIVRADDTYTCVGDNQFEFEPGIRQHQLIALVTAFYRGDRKISVSSFYYRSYCRFWHYSRPLRKFYFRCAGFLRKLLK